MEYLSSVFGLLEPQPNLKIPILDPSFEYSARLDLFKYGKQDDYIALTCACNRQEYPYFLKQSLFDHIYPIQGQFACEHCLNDKRNAKTIKDHLRLALIQNAETIEQGHHLLLDFSSDKIYDPVKKQMVRVRRIIYELYYNTTLKSNKNVLTGCDNKNCLCPLHLIAANSPAVKVTPDMKTDIHAWAANKISNKMIQQLIQQKYQKTVSLRTIINVKKSKLV